MSFAVFLSPPGTQLSSINSQLSEFTYAQLDDSAQERARQWYLESLFFSLDSDGNPWCECILNDWKAKLAKLGFDDAKIAYSGFSSQGDGASFEAGINPKRLKLPKLLCHKIATAKKIAPVIARLEGRETHWRDEFAFDVEITGHIKRDSPGNYVHYNTIDCSLSEELGHGIEADADLSKTISAWVTEQEAYLQSQARDLSKEIYRDLDQAYSDYTSDDSIADCLENGDYTFDEDGTAL